MKANELADFMAEEDLGLGGEFLAYMALLELPAPWRVLRNLLLPTATGEAQDTEIDLVLLHTSGVYVLEVKQYSGWIFGHPKDKYWTQTCSDGRGGSRKFKLYNPLWQNFGHVQALKQNLAVFGALPLWPIVVFGDHCEFRTQLSTSAEPVIHVRELADTITRMAMQQGDCLSAYDLDMIYRYLKPLENPSAQRREAHIKHVQSK